MAAKTRKPGGVESGKRGRPGAIATVADGQDLAGDALPPKPPGKQVALKPPEPAKGKGKSKGRGRAAPVPASPQRATAGDYEPNLEVHDGIGDQEEKPLEDLPVPIGSGRVERVWLKPEDQQRNDEARGKESALRVVPAVMDGDDADDGQGDDGEESSATTAADHFKATAATLEQGNAGTAAALVSVKAQLQVLAESAMSALRDSGKESVKDLQQIAQDLSTDLAAVLALELAVTTAVDAAAQKRFSILLQRATDAMRARLQSVRDSSGYFLHMRAKQGLVVATSMLLGMGRVALSAATGAVLPLGGVAAAGAGLIITMIGESGNSGR